MWFWLVTLAVGGVAITDIHATKCNEKVSLSGPEIVSLLKNGTRVIRGKDWTWGSQDGGPGHKGRVTNADRGDGWVDVVWDTGYSDLYRMGYENIFDLQLACSEFINSTSNTAQKETTPQEDTVATSTENLNLRTTALPIIVSGPKLVSLFKNGTRVVRGKDWEWGDQDGGVGKKGTIINKVDRGWVRVRWDSGNVDVYRMGSSNKYDLYLAQSDKEEINTSATPISQLNLGQENITCGVNTISGPELAAFLKIGTRVVRGQDWIWGSQDGGPGNEGRVTTTDKDDGWVTVEWDTGDENSYRMGSQHKYDLQLACSETLSEMSTEFGTTATKTETSTRSDNAAEATEFWIDATEIDTTTLSAESVKTTIQEVVEETTADPRSYAIKEEPLKKISTPGFIKNILEGNELFGKLVGKEMDNLPISSRIQTMQDVLEIFKKYV